MQRLPIGKIGTAPPTGDSKAVLNMELAGVTLTSFDEVLFVPQPANRRVAKQGDGQTYAKSPYCLDFDLAKTGVIDKDYVEVTLTTSSSELEFHKIDPEGLGSITAGTKEAQSRMWYISHDPAKIVFLIKNDKLAPSEFEFNIGIVVTNGQYSMPVLIDPKVYNAGGTTPPPPPPPGSGP